MEKDKNEYTFWEKLYIKSINGEIGENFANMANDLVRYKSGEITFDELDDKYFLKKGGLQFVLDHEGNNPDVKEKVEDKITSAHKQLISRIKHFYNTELESNNNPYNVAFAVYENVPDICGMCRPECEMLGVNLVMSIIKEFSGDEKQKVMSMITEGAVLWKDERQSRMYNYVVNYVMGEIPYTAIEPSLFEDESMARLVLHIEKEKPDFDKKQVNNFLLEHGYDYGSEIKSIDTPSNGLFGKIRNVFKGKNSKNNDMTK